MNALADHTIAFTGLKDGLHTFHYRIGQEFFDAAAEEELLGGDLRVTVDLQKGPTMLVTNIHVDGTVKVLCDRCNAPLDFPVKGDQRQIFQFTGRDADTDDEEMVGLDPSDHQVNLTHYIYECIRLHLPFRRVHPDGQCDPEVDLGEVAPSDTEVAPDPRWEALKALKDKRP
jgi:uncharacterized protein